MNLWVFVDATYFSSENQNLSPMAEKCLLLMGNVGLTQLAQVVHPFQIAHIIQQVTFWLKGLLF